MSDTKKVLYTVLVLFVGLLITTGIIIVSIKPWEKKKAIERPFDLHSSKHPASVEIFTLSGSQTNKNDTSQYTVNKVPSLSNLLIYEYLFKSGAKCSQINFEGKSVWKYSESSNYGYPESFKINITTKRVVITFKDYYSYYSFNTNVWNLDFTVKEKCLIELNLDNSKSPEKYFFRDTGKRITYTPDFGCCFNKVKNGQNVLWETQDHNSAAKQVMILKLADGKKTVTIFTIDGLSHCYNL